MGGIFSTIFGSSSAGPVVVSPLTAATTATGDSPRASSQQATKNTRPVAKSVPMTGNSNSNAVPSTAVTFTSPPSSSTSIPIITTSASPKQTTSSASPTANPAANQSMYVNLSTNTKNKLPVPRGRKGFASERVNMYGKSFKAPSSLSSSSSSAPYRLPTSTYVSPPQATPPPQQPQQQQSQQKQTKQTKQQNNLVAFVDCISGKNTGGATDLLDCLKRSNPAFFKMLESSPKHAQVYQKLKPTLKEMIEDRSITELLAAAHDRTFLNMSINLARTLAAFTGRSIDLVGEDLNERMTKVQENTACRVPDAACPMKAIEIFMLEYYMTLYGDQVDEQEEENDDALKKPGPIKLPNKCTLNYCKRRKDCVSKLKRVSISAAVDPDRKTKGKTLTEEEIQTICENDPSIAPSGFFNPDKQKQAELMTLLISKSLQYQQAREIKINEILEAISEITNNKNLFEEFDAKVDDRIEMMRKSRINNSTSSSQIEPFEVPNRTNVKIFVLADEISKVKLQNQRQSLDRMFKELASVAKPTATCSYADLTNVWTELFDDAKKKTPVSWMAADGTDEKISLEVALDRLNGRIVTDTSASSSPPPSGGDGNSINNDLDVGVPYSRKIDSVNLARKGALRLKECMWGWDRTPASMSKSRKLTSCLSTPFDKPLSFESKSTVLDKIKGCLVGMMTVLGKILKYGLVLAVIVGFFASLGGMLLGDVILSPIAFIICCFALRIIVELADSGFYNENDDFLKYAKWLLSGKDTVQQHVQQYKSKFV